MTDQAKPAEKPTRLNPIVTLDIKFFWDGCDKEKLLGQKCSDCGQFRFPPRPMCPNCHSTKVDLVECSGRGTVYSWVRPQHPKPVGFKEPPIVALIDLEEGIRLVSNLYDIEFEDVTPGLPVEMYFVPTAGNRKLPVFRPVKS